MSATEFEFIERSDSPCPSIVKMWVLLESSPSPLKLTADITKTKDLDDFKKILKHEYEEKLKNVSLEDIVFLYNNDTIRPDASVQIFAQTTTAGNPLVVRYTLSAVNINATLVFGQKQEKYKIQHATDSFDQLKTFAKEIFDDLEEANIYFENDGTKIRKAYDFNTVLTSKTVIANNIDIRLKVLVEGRKKYSEWRLKEVFKVILGGSYRSLLEMEKLNMEEYAPVDPPFTEEELKDFVKQLNKVLNSLDREFSNEMMNRTYINEFMVSATDYIRQHITSEVKLDMERYVNGKFGYGPIDYLVVFDKILLVLCEAKSQDMNQGVAQLIVQMRSAIEDLSKQEQDQVIYGIATTGKSWRFVRWNGPPENPAVHISKEYFCSFKNNMEPEKEILTYITQILKAQADAKIERPSKRVKVNE